MASHSMSTIDYPMCSICTAGLGSEKIVHEVVVMFPYIPAQVGKMTLCLDCLKDLSDVVQFYPLNSPDETRRNQ